METPATEEERVVLSNKLSNLERQIKEKEKLIVEVDKELKESDEELVTKTQELHASEKLLKEWQDKVALETEKRTAFFDVKQSSTGYTLQSPANGSKAMRFESIKWEDEAITGNLQEIIKRYGNTFVEVISSNAVQMDTVICIGFGEYVNDSSNYLHNSLVGFLQTTPNFKFTSLWLQTKMKDFALATCKDTLHLIGGEVLDSEKPSFSNLVISCVGQTTLESKYLPMKTASASPAVVTYKERIVVVHGRGANGEIEFLDTNSANPVWVQLRVHFPLWETPSATVVGRTLVVWMSGLYCTSLESIVANDQQSGPPGIYANPAPPIDVKTLHLLTLQGQLLAVDCSSSQYGNSIYAYHSATREWMNIDNRKQFALVLATSETSLVLFSTTPKLAPNSFVGCRGSVSCPV